MWRILVNLKRELAELLFGSYVRKGGRGRGRHVWMAARERRDVTRVVLNRVESTTWGGGGEESDRYEAKADT